MRNPRENRNISPEYGHSLHRSRVIPFEYADPRGDAMWHHMSTSRQLRISLSPLPGRQFRQAPDRSYFGHGGLECCSRAKKEYYVSQHQSRYKHSSKVRYCDHDLHVPNYIELDHRTELRSQLEPQPIVTRKPVPLDYGPDRSQPASQKQESMPKSGTHSMGLREYCCQVQDPFDGDDDRGTKRSMVLHQSEIPHSGTIKPSHLRFTEGGSSSYQHSRLYYMPQEDVPRVAVPQSPNHLLSRRKLMYRVDVRYNDIVGDNVHRKTSYPSPDYSKDDGDAHSLKNAREWKVSTDPPNHCRVRDLGRLSRSMRRPMSQRDGYESDTDGAPISQRERMENSKIFSNSGKGLCDVYYSPPRDKYVDAVKSELSHVQMGGNTYHVHQMDNYADMSDHADSNCDFHANDVCNANSDAEDEGSDNCCTQRRVTIQDRLGLSSPLVINYKSYPVRDRLSSTVTIGKPNLMHRQCDDPNAIGDPNAVQTNSVKKRRWSGPCDFIKKNLLTNKFQKRACEDKPEPNGRNLNYGNTKGSDGDATGTGSSVRDPPEGSMEFKRQAERAFLKYARVINDSAWEKMKFLQPWKGSIYCYVCGRHSSKEFAITHDLVMHTFHTQKPGLKTAHRGLQKALCLSFGWNWCMAPDQSKLYQVGPADEAEVLKQDLILWPPIVVICNSSVDLKALKSKAISLEAIECMLKGILGEGKAKLSFGKPSDQCVVLVKFPPVYSGFVLAEKLHIHFSRSNHGKDQLEFFLKSQSDTKIDENPKEMRNEDVLYGYLAGIEDVDKLDSVTKKTYEGQKDIFKSRMEIQARAASLFQKADN